MHSAEDVHKLLGSQIAGLRSVIDDLQRQITVLTGALGTMAYQNANAVSITGGSVTITGEFEDQAVEYQVPVNNFNITVPDHKRYLILNPAGILATGAVKMPANPRPWQEVFIMTSQTVSGFTLTANTGQSIVDVPLTLTADKHTSYKYNPNNTTWFRFT